MSGIRSLLFVPAEDRRLAKIGKTKADAYIIDLEDSIAPEEKDKALEKAVAFLRNCDEPNLFIRINHSRYENEVNALKQFNVGFMLPKIEREIDYDNVRQLLLDRKVIALIETPRAVLNADQIASIAWVDALAFGAEDYTVAMSMENSLENLFVPKSLLTIAAKANQKRIYDTPCFNPHDDKALDFELRQAFSLGFDGKLAIHPSQVEPINQTFGKHDQEYMQYLVNIYDASGKAVCEIDGRVYEKLHIDRIRKMLELPDKQSKEE